MKNIKELWLEDAWRNTLFGLCAAIVLVLVGVVWDIFYLRLMGIATICINLPYVIVRLFDNKDKLQSVNVSYVGCCLFPIIITVLIVVFSSERYISGYNSLQHIYEDCSTFKSSDSVMKVSRLEGFFFLDFVDCNVCKDREKEEEKKQLEENNKEKVKQKVLGLHRMRELEEFDDSLNLLIDEFDGKLKNLMRKYHVGDEYLHVNYYESFCANETDDVADDETFE